MNLEFTRIQSESITIIDCSCVCTIIDLRRKVQAQFPRKGKLGRLAKGSQKTFTRFLMGYHKRYYQLIFEEDEEKITYTWDEPVKKDPGADYKPGRFKHLDEAIRNTKKD